MVGYIEIGNYLTNSMFCELRPMSVQAFGIQFLTIRTFALGTLINKNRNAVALFSFVLFVLFQWPYWFNRKTYFKSFD